MRRVVRRQQLGGTRPVQVVEPRDPEAQRGGAQDGAPAGVLVVGQRAHRVIGVDHRLRARRVEGAGGLVDAPVVHRHGEVEQPDRAAGEVEVDQAADPLAAGRAVDQHVVPEQVGVDRPGRELLETRAAKERVLEDDLLGEHVERVVGQEALEPGHRFLPPADATQVRLEDGKVLPGHVHPGQHLAGQRALVHGRFTHRLAGEPRDDRGRLALDLGQQRTGAILLRFGHRHVSPCEVAHQLEVEGQLLERQPLEQRQHVPPALGRQEEVRVLDARRDAFEFDQFAERELGQERRGFRTRQRGEDGHGIRPPAAQRDGDGAGGEGGFVAGGGVVRPNSKRRNIGTDKPPGLICVVPNGCWPSRLFMM